MLPKETSLINIIGTVKTIDHETSGVKVLLQDVFLEDIPPNETPRYVRVKFADKFGTPEIGAHIKALGVLMPPSPPVAPELYDFQRHMYFQGIGATGYAVKPFEVLGSNKRQVINNERTREKIKERIFDSKGQENSKAILIALLTGERRLIDDDLWEDIRKSGIAHLLAISGLHIGLVAGIVFFMFRAILAFIPYTAVYWPIKKISAVASFMAIVYFCWIVDAPVSAQRAVFMTGIVLFAILIDRVAISLRLAAFAGMILLLWAPEMLVTPGFQMSFAAVVALIAFYESLSDRFSSLLYGRGLLYRISTYFIVTLLTTIVASIATAPFALYHFHRVALLPGLLANMAAVPLTSLMVMPLGLVGLVLMPFGWEGIFFKWAMQCIDIIIKVAHQTATMQGSVLNVSAWPVYALIVIVFGALWLAIWLGRIRWLGVPIMICGIIFAFNMPQFDVLLSNDGKLIALHAPNGDLAFSSSRAERYTKDSWNKAYGGENKLYWPLIGDLDEVDLTCDDAGCIFTKDSMRIAFPKTQMAAALDCQKADFIIAPQFYELPTACTNKNKITRQDVKRNGAHSIQVKEQEINVKTVRDVRGSRPWAVYGQ